MSFDTDQIEKVITYGFQDEEQLRYMEEFKKILATIEKNGKEA